MNLALVDIRQLVTVAAGDSLSLTGSRMRDLGIIENAAVIVEDSTISWVGKMEDLKMARLKEADVIECGDYVAMPGFVDAHTHLVFAGSRENEFAMRSAGATYQEIASRGGGILSTVNAVRTASKKDLKKHARRHLAALMRHGTTTVEIKSGYGLDMESEIKLLEVINELRKEEVIRIVPTFLGAHAVPPEFRHNMAGYVTEIIDRMLPYVADHKLADFCDVFCELGYFGLAETEAILSRARELGMTAKLHAEELNPLGGASLAARFNAASADHLEHVSENDIRALATRGVPAVLLPGVSFFLNHRYAPARALIDAGVPVAIATDFNPGSCMSYSMPLMMTIACTQMGLTPEEAIAASTINAAAALQLSGDIGSIETGKKADIILLNIPNHAYLPYHFGENHVEMVIKDGVVLET